MNPPGPFLAARLTEDANTDAILSRPAVTRPAVTLTTTNAPTIMIAEKGAVMIEAPERERPAA